jgi:hypothetical protein
VRDIELRPFWPDSNFEWLTDPEESGRDPFSYHFPGKDAWELLRERVINHVLLDRGILKPGCPVEGWLLGVGSPKPDLLMGATIDVTLAIIGYYQNECTTTIKLSLDRIRKHVRKSARGYREGLFAIERTPNLESPNFGDIGQTPAPGLPVRHEVTEPQSRSSHSSTDEFSGVVKKVDEVPQATRNRPTKNDRRC